MKRLKLFFACLLMAVLSIGQVWADNAAVGATLWAENFAHFGTNTPSTAGTGSGTTIFGGATITYAQSSTNTKGYNETLAGGTAPELLLAKSNTTWTISGIPTGGATEMALSFKSNKTTFTVTVNDNTNLEVSGSQKSWTISVKEGKTSPSTFNITIKNTGSSNARIDDVALTVVTAAEGGGTPIPTLSVSPAVIDFGTVEQNAVVASQTVAVSFANLTGSVAYSGLSSPFTASGSISASGEKITIAANTANVGNYSQTLTVQSTADSKSAEVTVKMNVVEPFAGSILEITKTDFTTVSYDDNAGDHEKDGVTFTTAKVYQSGSSIQFQKTNGLLYNKTDLGEIAKIEITTYTGKANNLVVYSGTSENPTSGAVSGSASGSVTTYTFASGNGYFAIKCNSTGASNVDPIKIYYSGAAILPSAELAFTDENHLAKVGANFTAPTLTNPHSVAVTYASSDADVVAVSADGATVTIKAAGKAEITASFAGDENYKEGSASYTIYVAAEAGTAADPLSEASAKALIDLGCTMSAHVHGTVLGSQDATKFTVTLAGGFQFYKLKDLGNVAFESAYIGNGDEVTAVGTLTKYNSTYELAEGCYLTAYTEYTEPLVDISNTKATAYTVAEALALAVNPTSDLTKAVYIKGVVYDVKNFNSTNGTLDIYIKDEGVDNKFEFYKCAGIYDESLTAFSAEDDVQVGDEVIGYGVMKYYSGGSIWEFDNTATGDYLVELTRPEIAVSSVELDQDAASIEVNETVTLHAIVNPDNASNKAITWSVQSGNTYASVADGVVTGLVAGEAVIRAASTADPTKYAECTVTVTAADPTKHVVTFDATVDAGESPLSKSNISMACSSGALNNGSEYRLYKSSTTTFECSVGNIIKIEFTGVSGNPVSGFGDPEVGTLVTDGNNGVWTGNAASVSFVASGAQVRATEIKVTYKEDAREEADLEWSTDAVILTVGDEFIAPTLNNPNSIAAGEITIESDNTDLATVSEGVVSLVADATGEATITATFAGNEDYKPAVVSYTITVNEAGLDNVTFDATLDVAETGELSISKSGFTLEFTNGALDNGENYRLYKSQTMTLSSTAYYIKKIEFTCTSGNPISGFADAEGLDKENNQWTGQANSVELTASNAQVRIEKLKVYYIEDTRAASGLAWSDEEVEITLGDAFTAATLQNPNSIAASAITIASDNENLAEVNEGVVSLVEDATGTAHITATFAGNETYKPATVSYTIIVNPAYSIYVQPSLNVNFGSVNQNAEVADKSITVTLTGVDAATLTLEGTGASAFTISPAAALTASGDITISASSANIGTFAATLTISDDASQAESKVVNISITVNEVVVPETPVSTTSKWVPATEIVDGMQVLIVGVNNSDYFAMGAQTNNNRTAVQGSVDGEGVFTPGDNTMAFTLVAQGDGTYAIMSSNDKYLYAAASGNNYLRTQAGVDDNAKWTLSLTSAVAESSSNRNVMQFNSGSSIFSCYASASQKSIALYVPQTTPATPDYTRNVTVGNYGTICLPNGGNISGAKLYDLEYYDGASTLYLLEVNGNAMVAGRPYIFLPSVATIEVFYTDEENASAGSFNGLVGSYIQKNVNEIDGENYILYQNAYYLVNSEAYVGANRAYIHMEDVPDQPTPQVGQAPRRRVGMAVNGKQTPTGFESINASEKPMKLMIDGQIFILRGQKMYDATGRLVK